MTTSKLTLEQADLNKVDSGRHTPISGFDRDTMTGFAKLNIVTTTEDIAAIAKEWDIGTLSVDRTGEQS